MSTFRGKCDSLDSLGSDPVCHIEGAGLGQGRLGLLDRERRLGGALGIKEECPLLFLEAISAQTFRHKMRDLGFLLVTDVS